MNNMCITFVAVWILVPFGNYFYGRGAVNFWRPLDLLYSKYSLFKPELLTS